MIQKSLFDCVICIVCYENKFIEYSTMNIRNERDWIGSSPNFLKLFYFNLKIIWQFNLYH